MKLYIDTKEKRHSLGDLFGIFFEDLNHAADGGMYGELIQNGRFEFDAIDNSGYDHLTAWEVIENDGRIAVHVETGNPVTWKNPHYLGMDLVNPGSEIGVKNLGFSSGIPLKTGETYLFSCYARREQDYEQPICISLRSKASVIYAEENLYVSREWKKYETAFQVQGSDDSAQLWITAGGGGKVYLDFVSLFPSDTFCGRKNGFRRDIAEKLQELHPKFMRFPGGCLVHRGALDPLSRESQYRWKNTIGPVEERPARRNSWGYNQSLGIGFMEYFCFCEDIGTKPLPVLPAGYDPHTGHAVPLDELQPWIDDALDLIEFANGDGNTEWGRKRMELGHPEPFQLEYLGIGNEEVGEAFFERYKIISKAVKKKYPNIKIIGTSGPNAAGGEFERGWTCAEETETDFVDEHYYQTPEWFLANHHRYDGYSRDKSRVFLGEYASWGNSWYHALAESTYMIGLERNADIVGLSCYAPLLCNRDYVDWSPDLIWFDNKQVVCSANYYIQKLFMHHQGDFSLAVNARPDLSEKILKWDEDALTGKIILEGYESDAEYSQIELINEDTKQVCRFEDCQVRRGERVELTTVEIPNYTLKLKAKETGGWQGFRIRFAYSDKENNLYWILGGWQNQDTFVGELVTNRSSDYSQYLFSVEKNREYSLELHVRGRKIETVIDGVTYHKTEKKPVLAEPLYYSAAIDSMTDDVIVKLTNIQSEARDIEIQLDQSRAYDTVQLYQMYGWDKSEENTFADPERIVPYESGGRIENNNFKYTMPGESFVIARFRLTGV